MYTRCYIMSAEFQLIFVGCKGSLSFCHIIFSTSPLNFDKMLPLVKFPCNNFVIRHWNMVLLQRNRQQDKLVPLLELSLESCFYCLWHGVWHFASACESLPAPFTTNNYKMAIQNLRAPTQIHEVQTGVPSLRPSAEPQTQQTIFWYLSAIGYCGWCNHTIISISFVMQSLLTLDMLAVFHEKWLFLKAASYKYYVSFCQ